MGKFYLVNESNSKIDLQDEVNYCVATDVKNLGYEVSSEYIRIGDHFVKNYLNPKQTQLDLSLNFFRPNVYEKVQAVGNFLATATELYLVYQPGLKSGVEYRREVDVSSYLKGSIKDGFICYTLKLMPTSLFYFKRATRFEITELPGEKRYDFTWDATYNDYSNRSIDIDGGNHVEVAFDLEILGYTENPKIEILDGETVIHSLTFPITVQEGEKILYSSLDRDIKVDFVNASGVTRSMFSDFSLEDNVFFKIPKSGGTVRFTSDTDVMNTIVVTAYFFFKVV
ncbi:MAG: hypothetical protein PHC95_04955 [Parabacteroides sp.]|nr:hypothetical protein [Parabacteroides sp.]